MKRAGHQAKPGARPPAGGGTFVAVIPAGIADSATLLRTLAERLRFPGWFGGNWNALADCLRDLSWIPERTVVIRHEDTPRLPAPELAVYREILAESAAAWQRDGGARRLDIRFP